MGEINVKQCQELHMKKELHGTESSLVRYCHATQRFSLPAVFPTKIINVFLASPKHVTH
jgi:hypothetical protein